MMIKRESAKRRRQRALNQKFAGIIIANLLIVLTIILIPTMNPVEVSENNKSEGESNSTVYESLNDHSTAVSPANASNVTTIVVEIKTPTVESEKTTTSFSRNLSQEEKYLLAKIAMAEAEGESIETKVYVILTVLNRVYSDDKYFPDTVKEVIFQNRNGIYQFSPVMSGGRWWSVEPDENCWIAVEIVNAMEKDTSMGALYFESCKGESWHSRNLEFLFESDDVRFYK